MRIAVPSEDDRGVDSSVCPHFGRARYFTLVDAADGRIERVEVVESPFAEHGPGDIPRFLKGLRVDVVLAYGMGPRAQEFFREFGIRVVTGARGRVGDVVRDYLSGRLSVDESWRSKQGFQEHGHGCGHGAG